MFDGLTVPFLTIFLIFFGMLLLLGAPLVGLPMLIIGVTLLVGTWINARAARREAERQKRERELIRTFRALP